MPQKTAIIIGAGGQDGKILRNFLKEKDYGIIGIHRHKNTYYNIQPGEEGTDILDIHQVEDIIKRYVPDEVYYLAAYHHSSQDIIPSDAETFKNSTDIHVNAYFNFLEAVALFSNKTKICYASSCLIYGGSQSEQQNELTLPAPNSIYGITKLEGMHLGSWFAEKYNLQVTNAILYNHESEFRSSKFVSMKIIQGAINISKGLQENIVLGDLSTQVDRGYAYDYVEAMYQLLQSNKAGNYIISSGKLHTIQDLVEIVFNYFRLDWEKYVQSDVNIIKRKTGILFGDYNKVKKDIGWQPKIGFTEMIVDILKKINGDGGKN